MTDFAQGGIMPSRSGDGDEVPAVLSPGRVILIGKPNLFATTPEGAALLAEQMQASREYIKTKYGPLSLDEAKCFYEEDEDPRKIFAAYDAGMKVVTTASAQAGAPMAELAETLATSADDAEDWVCGRCDRGQCGRCADPACTCCNGNPED